MIKEIYKKYFQKSYTFLLPILKINKFMKPIHTYIGYSKQDINFEDGFLICEYDKTVSNFYAIDKHLLSNKNFSHIISIDEKKVLYVFTLNDFREDYNNFLKGKYSKFSNELRQILSSYYGVFSAEWIYIESFLNPEKYYEEYAQILNVDVSFLKSVGELCDIFNPNLENYDN